ncbi:hypothetical protein BKA69DRAFT_1049551 [Paraphysoderma sedebokerense]|nr:hypothetical protein BKA69DRAFT_1049551 [Paraphysoderma sedebokerense]
MHPDLESYTLKDCEDIIQQLQKCHETAGLKKYLGWCNSVKYELNRCLTADYKRKRLENSEKAKERRSKAEQAWKDLNLK